MLDHILAQWPAILKIVGIDIVLSGDNAMVIALACKNLPSHQRKWGMILGAGAAVILRIIFTLLITSVLQYPYLHVIGGLLLLWIAIKLLLDDGGHDHVAAKASLWGAVMTIVVADAVMSLDNVLAIAAAANGIWWLVVFGLIVSIPLVVGGSTLIMWAIQRYPIVVWAGAALLGSVAGGMIYHEKFIQPLIDAQISNGYQWSEVAGALFVVIVGWLLMKMRPAKTAA